MLLTKRHTIVVIILFFMFVAGAAPALSASLSLSSDFAANSLTINDGDTFTTNGYNVDIGPGGITIAADGGSGGGTLDATNGAGGNSAITSEGNWSNGGTFTADTSTVTFDGTTSATLDSGSSNFNNLEINKTDGADANDNVTVQTNDLTVNGTLTISDGELIQQRPITTGTVTLSDASSKWTNVTGNAHVTLSGNVDNSGTITFNGPTIQIRSSDANQRNWQGSGTFNMTSVDVQDQTCTGGTPASITVSSGTNSGNNINWVFGSNTVTGTAYDNYFSATPVSGITVTVVIYDVSAGTRNFYTDVTDGSGVYLVTNGTIDTGDVVVAYLDDIANEGTAVTKANSNGSSISGLDVHYSSVYIFDEGGGIANADLALLDSNTDNDINYTVSGGNVTITSTFWLGIDGSYTPGGDVTLQSTGALGIWNTATLDAGSNTITLAADWANLGTFTATGTGTVIFNGTSSVNNGGSSFNNITIGDGVSGGSVTFITPTDINGTLDFNNAGGATTLDLNSQTVNFARDVDLTNADTFSAAGSTVIFDGGAAQSVTSNGHSFGNITITNASAGGVTFADALSTGTLTNTTNASTMKFATAGMNTITTTLTLTGGTGANMITLGPATASTNWDISPPAGTTVTGVNVSYSQANKVINANSSNNGGNNNANWNFGTNTRYWVGAGNWSNTANWSDTSGGGGGFSSPSSGDTAIFDGNGLGNCTLDMAPTVDAISNAGAYTGTFNTANFDIDVSSNFQWDGGTFNAGSSTVTVGGDWDSSGGTFNYGTSTVNLTGTGNLTTNGGNSKDFYNLSMAAASNTTTLQANRTVVANVATLGTGTLTSPGNQYLQLVKSDGSPLINPGATISIGTVLFLPDSLDNATISIPGGTYNTGMQYQSMADNVTFQISGNLQVNNTLWLVAQAGTAGTIVNTQDNDLSAGRLRLGESTVNGPVTVNLGNSIVDLGSFSGNCLDMNTNGGSHTLNLNNAIVTCADDWQTIDGTGTISVNAGTSTVTFDGGAAQSITSNGSSFNAVTITNASAAGVTFTDALSTNTLTNTTNASTMKFATTGTHTIATTLTLTGGIGPNMITLEPATASTNWDISPPAGTTVTGVDVSYSQSNKLIIANSSNNGGNNNANWQFGTTTRYWVAAGAGNWNDPANWSDTSGGSGGFSVPSNGDTTIFDSNGTGDCTLDIAPSVSTMTVNTYPGAISTGTNNLTVTNLALSSGTLTLGNQTTTVSGTLTVSGGTLAAGSGNINAGNVTIASGTFTAPGSGQTLTASGDFIHSGGAFAANSGTVTLNGSDQSITGSTTFYNLAKTVAASATLTFDNTATQTITNNLTLNGSSGQLLFLQSNSSGNPWEIDPQGSHNVSFVNVQDSNNINAVFISAANSVSSGNNTGWIFAALTMDVDNDGVLEEARDIDGNSATGYEVFFDPGGSVVSTAEESINGDSDTQIDHFVDLDGDSVADKYWDPDNAIFKDIILLDVNGDGADDWVYDSDDNGTYDHAFNDAGSVFIDPFGVVFDSSTNTPIIGAEVTIYNNENGQPCVPDNGAPPAFPATNECIANGDSNPLITDESGVYGFNTAVGGSYFITVSADNYTYPFSPPNRTFEADRYICVDNPDAGYPHADCQGVSGSRGEVFTIAGPDIITMDHPMDASPGLIKLTKTVNKGDVSVGDIVTYTVTIESMATSDLINVLISDNIPAGFKYIKDRAILDGNELANPEGNRPITFNIGTVAVGETLTLKYQLIIGSGVSYGKHENSAWALYDDGTVISNVAREYVTVVPDPLFDLGTVIGKVFHDRNENGVQDGEEETGIGNVQIVTEEGTVITADKNGMYHLAGVTPGRHIIRIDERTLPDGMYLTTSRAVIIDITPGILQKVNFGANNSQNTEHRTQNTDYRIQNREHSSQFTEQGESMADSGQRTTDNGLQDTDNKENDFIFVALADGKVGYNEVKGNIEPFDNYDRYDEGFWSEGRLAFYLKGKIKGKYLITSSFDTDRERKELFRNLDPDKYYPVYGDESTVNYEATDTQGVLYLAIEWDKSKIMWGNYNTQLSDTDLANFNRTLFGARLHLETVSTTPSGKALTKLIIFQAEAQQKAAHNEFIGTGGSLYYLKHRPVTEGSAKVTIQVRDKNTDIVIAEVHQEEGKDYEVDYSNGRIMFFEPVSQIAESDTIISSSIVDGNSLYVVVDYEYEVIKNEFSDWSYGGRVEQSITGLIDKLQSWMTKNKSQATVRSSQITDDGERTTDDGPGRMDYGPGTADNGLRTADDGLRTADHGFIKDIRLGGTFVQESNDTGDYELKGIDTALYLGEHTLITGEYAESDSRGVDNFISTDGGLSFTEISIPDNAHGEAYSLKALTRIYDMVDLGGYYEKIGSGFSDYSTVSQQGKESLGGDMGIDFSEHTRLNISHDTQKLLDQGNALTSTQVGARQTDITTAHITHRMVSMKFTGEYRHIEVKNKGSSPSETNIEGDTAAARADYDVKDNLSVFLEQQVTLKGNANYQTTAGLSVEPYDWLKVTASGTVGSDGNAASIGTIAKVNDRTEIFNTYSLSNSRTGGKKTTVVTGSRRKVTDTMDFSTEMQQNYSDSEKSNINIFGLSGEINERWGLSGSFARGVVQSVSGDISKRNAGSVGITYTEKDRLKASSKLEIRIDDGQENEWQYLSYSAARWKVNRDTTLFGKINLSLSRNTTTNQTEAKYKELVFGSAYRPVNLDRLNFLAKYTYLEDDITPGQTDASDIDELRAHVIAGEAVYDLTDRWQIVEKLAFKQAEEKVDGFDFTKTQTWLWINRVNYNLYRNWQAGAEYRFLKQRQAEDVKQGILLEVSRYITKDVQLGIGYNFTDFNDDLTYLDYTSHGPFIRLTAKILK